jgi:pimeloyl-ACP methyl ester carboxylesterase
MKIAVQVSRKSRCGRRPRHTAWLGVSVAVLCLAAVSCGGQSANSLPENSLTVKSCTVDGRAARCGTLIVPENWLTGTGRTIPVRFVVFPATSPDKAPDPVVYFAGGPGSSAIADISSWLTDLQGLNTERDLVFIEQRGTGQSNPLNCPASSLPVAGKAALRASVQSCLDRLHVGLRFYTTAMFTDDVSQILTDLHYAKVNLFGGSYGATAAQVFLLRHPGQVRTMSLESGTLLTIPIFEREAGNSQLALEHVFACCAADPACRLPVLSFNGDADPTDQPRNMAGMQKFWPDSREIVLPGQGHYVTSASWPCEGALTQAFIQQASVAHLDTSCLAAIPAPAFDATLQALTGGG